MSEHRLPRTVRPSHYTLHLTADPGRADFDGHVTIDVAVDEAVDRIVLHASQITVHEATVLLHDDATPLTATVEADAQGQRLTIRPSAPLTPGKARLSISYSGRVRQDMAGLYLSRDGDAMCLATQCEATDARTIVPCFDEPAYKATWEWRVTAPAGLQVLTNGTLVETVEAGGIATHRFAPTPPMSSYLIACVIGTLGATPSVVSRDVPFRVWATQGHEVHGAHGNELAARMLPWYEDYFGQPYAFTKYDQVAVPSFAFGAMENAGLVLFRPSLVLLDGRTASWDDRRGVALVVAHEFAHMWFGDLVTMAWWDDLWLNEAFAEWIAHKCAHAMDPSLEVWVPFRQRAAGALSTDALASTHAIYHPVKTPEEAQEMFDAITYGKGSAVMRMLESFLGEEAFRAGLRSYMAAFAFGNAQGRDLWSHLAEASGQDVAGIMQDWIAQAGHPTVACAWDKEGLHVRQERTRSSPLAEVPATTWRVPLVVRWEDDAGTHTHRHLMTGAAETVSLPVRGTLRWVWPNADDGGFYRVALDEALLAKAIDHHAQLTAPERVALLRDLWIQVRQDKLDPATFLAALTTMLDPDAHYEVVEHQAGMLRAIEQYLHGEESLPAYRQWVRHVLGDAWTRIGSPRDGEDAPTRQRRAAILRAIGGIGGHDGALALARATAAKERDDPATVEPSLAGAAVAVEAVHGDGTTLDTHLKTYRVRRDGTASPQEVERYLYVLPAFRDTKLVARVLELMASDGVSAQAEGPLLRSMLAQPHAQVQAWQYLQTHWPRVEERLGEAWLAILVEACGELPPALAGEVTSFLDAHLAGRAQQAYGRAKERLAQRAELEARLLPALRTWVAGLTAVAPA